MSDLNSRERVEWPARAVVTAGMPYGNKPLHFGHIGGVFVPADAFARFLRDRIGAENVRFVSGTDCFGSPINEGYRKLKEAGEFSGTIADYVLANHERQKATLEAFQVSLDIYEGSGIGHAGDVHQMISDQFIERLHESGHLKLDSTLQFYDAKAGTFLNYYLPTTQKLLNSYAEFEEAGVSGENLNQAKAKIRSTMDSIVAGFERQLDELYRADAMDIDSDIRVMETMLRRDSATVADDFGLGGTAVQQQDE